MVFKVLKHDRFLNSFHYIKRKMNLLSDKNFIYGEWVPAESNKVFEVKNPANGQVIGKVPDMDGKDAEKAVKAAAEAFKTWKDTTPKVRANLLRKWYDLLMKHNKGIAEIMTAESGKPIAESIGEIKHGSAYVEWYSEQARNLRGAIMPSSIPSKKMLFEYFPIGAVSLITPWNFPFNMVVRKASPALSVGCTCVVKPAEDTPLTALAIAKLAEEAGIPKGVINVVTSDRKNASTVGKVLCESPLIAGLSFTGSTQVGKILYKQCSVGVKRIAMELGGNAPFIVYNSADIKKAVYGAMESKFRNCGQTCVAANRFIVQDKIFDNFVSALVQQVKLLKIGDGTCEGTTMGPLVNQSQMDKMLELVCDASSKGAKIITGGKPIPQLGKLFFEPTVITGVDKGMKLYTEEIFGPIAPIIKFKTEEESLQVANCTEYGLAGYFFSEDIRQIFRVAKRMETGMVGVNEGRMSATESPFGGIKQSGFGKEGSHLGVLDYTYIKYICLGTLE